MCLFRTYHLRSTTFVRVGSSSKPSSSESGIAVCCAVFSLRWAAVKRWSPSSVEVVVPLLASFVGSRSFGVADVGSAEKELLNRGP